MSRIICFGITCGAASIAAQLGPSSCQSWQGGQSDGQPSLGFSCHLGGQEGALSQENLGIYRD